MFSHLALISVELANSEHLILDSRRRGSCSRSCAACQLTQVLFVELRAICVVVQDNQRLVNFLDVSVILRCLWMIAASSHSS